MIILLKKRAILELGKQAFQAWKSFVSIRPDVAGQENFPMRRLFWAPKTCLLGGKMAQFIET